MPPIPSLARLYRAMRTDVGLTQRSAAARIGRDASLIAQAEAGHRPFSEDLRDRLDEVVAAGDGDGPVRYLVVALDSEGGRHGLVEPETIVSAFAARDVADAVAVFLESLGHPAAAMPVREPWAGHDLFVIDEGTESEVYARVIAFLERFPAALPTEVER